MSTTEGPTRPVLIERNKDSVRIVAPANVLRRILFWIGDAVWPGWYETPEGKKTYFGYVEQATINCEITVADRDFWEVAETRVLAHLKVDGEEVFIKQ